MASESQLWGWESFFDEITKFVHEDGGSELYVLANSNLAEQVWVMGLHANPSNLLNDIVIDFALMAKLPVTNLTK